MMLTAAALAAPVPKPPPPDPLGKGYMGVYSAGENSLGIRQVIPNTPASAAGLRDGDVGVGGQGQKRPVLLGGADRDGEPGRRPRPAARPRAPVRSPSAVT